MKGGKTYTGLLCRLVLLAQLLEPVFLLLAQVRVLLLLGLVKTVDDDVFSLGNHDPLDLWDVRFSVMIGMYQSVEMCVPFCCP